MDSHAESDVADAQRATQPDPEGMGRHLQFIIEESEGGPGVGRQGQRPPVGDPEGDSAEF